MTDEEAAIFVVTAGVSVRGNLNGLQRDYTDPGGIYEAFLRDCFLCIGDFPPRRSPIEEVAEALGLSSIERPRKQNDTEDTPATCRDALVIQAIADNLPNRPSTRGLSAELSSLFADRAPHPKHGDHVLLLASDSDIGIRCAGLVGALLRSHVGGTLQRVDIGGVAATEDLSCVAPSIALVDPNRLAGTVTGPGVTVTVIGGLTADEEYAVASSGQGIAYVLGAAYAAARSSWRRLILHPIGGYKATIPLFTALAAHLPTGADIDIEMWSNHEQTTIGLRQPLLRIGVPDEEYWDLQDISRSQSPDDGSSTDHIPVRPRSSRWDGYAWHIHEGRYRLTDVGRSILELRAACAQEPSDSLGV